MSTKVRQSVNHLLASVAGDLVVTLESIYNVTDERLQLGLGLFFLSVRFQATEKVITNNTELESWVSDNSVVGISFAGMDIVPCPRYASPMSLRKVLVTLEGKQVYILTYRQR